MSDLDHADPCPFCAGTCIDYNIRRKGRRYYEEQGGALVLRWETAAAQYNIKCVNCNARGPKAASLTLAVAGWNKPARLDD